MSDAPSRERVPPPQLAALWALSFAISAIVGTHGVAYWDAGDYVRLALDGRQSGLLLGRPLFLFVSRMVLATGVDASNAEATLRWFWTGVSAFAPPALAMLTARLGFSLSASRAAGIFLALSPSFAHASHQVLTDGPALLLSIVALILALDRRAFAAGLVLGAAILTRETAAVHAVPLVLLLRRQSIVSLTACLVAVAVVVFVTAPPGLSSWFSNMSSSAAAHPLTARDFGLACLWLLAAGPVAVVIGASTFFRSRLRPPGVLDHPRVRMVTVPAAVASLVLLFYPDGAFSPRYVLAVVPIAFFIRAAPVLASRTRLLAIATVIPLAVAFFAGREADRLAARGATLTARITQLPQHALVVPGHFCPHARLAVSVTGRTDLDFVCPGWEWPPDVSDVLNRALSAGRAVAVDASEPAWVGPRETGHRRAVRDWLTNRKSAEIAGFTVVVR